MIAALWIGLGAVAGLVASYAAARVIQGGRTASVAIGMLGGFVGGAAMHLAAGDHSIVADLASPPAALAGGIVLIAIVARAGGFDPHPRA